ncbi:MAG TPA: sulfotransferase [Rhodocyclaceae bacterium]
MTTAQSPGCRPTSLSIADLLDEASRQTGLADFGDEPFREPLERLLAALESEAELNPFGRMAARHALLRSLKNRLWATACFKAHPEIRQRRIGSPLIVVGPIRSGTTRLQRMLATDGRFLHLAAWEGFNPAPRGTEPHSGVSARRDEVVEFLAGRRRLAPGADAAHPMDADWPEEEVLLLNYAFIGLSPVLLYRIPSFTSWLLAHDRRRGYREMLDLMRLVSWSRGDAEEAPWILKTPQHMLDLPLLAELIPDARFLFIHRDPVKTTASTLSLAWHSGVLNTDRPSRAYIRDTWLELCEAMARRCIAARQVLPAERQMDVYYADMNREWRTVMRRIYDFCDTEFTTQAEAGMADWLAESEREARHGGHRYALGEFGMTKGEVEARLGFYREHFKVPYELDRQDRV